MNPFHIVIVVLAAATHAAVGWLSYSTGKASGNAKAQAIQQSLNRAVAQLRDDAKALDYVRDRMNTIVEYSKQRQQRIAAAQASNATRQQAEQVRVEYITQYVPQGETECERVTDAIKRGLR